LLRNLGGDLWRVRPGRFGVRLHRSLRVFSLFIDGRGVLAFAAKSSVEARLLIEQRWFREDLERLTERGVSIRDGRMSLFLDNASEAELKQFLEVFSETGDEGAIVRLEGVRQAALYPHRSNYNG
jgi:hypothetical protein